MTLPSGKSKTSSDAKEVRKLMKRWASLPPKENGICLINLLPMFSSKRALARAIRRSESRVRQLSKVAEDDKKAHERVAASETKAEPAVARSGPTEQPQNLPGPQGIAHSPAKSLQSRRAEGSNVDISQLSPEMVVAQNGVGGKEERVPAGPSAEGHSIDVETAAKLLRDWIRWNFKPEEWSETVEDLKAIDWCRRQEFRDEVKEVGGISPSLPPEEVIESCKTDQIEQDLESDRKKAVRKRFARWASILLSDFGKRVKALEGAEELLKERSSPWGSIGYDPALKRPTRCIRSTRQKLEDFFDALAKDFPAKVLFGQFLLRRDEVEEALRYAAATFREGSPPPLS
jgi:hypothetical protein